MAIIGTYFSVELTFKGTVGDGNPIGSMPMFPHFLFHEFVSVLMTLTLTLYAPNPNPNLLTLFFSWILDVKRRKWF